MTLAHRDDAASALSVRDRLCEDIASVIDDGVRPSRC